jgi:hypothetical protein
MGTRINTTPVPRWPCPTCETPVDVTPAGIIKRHGFKLQGRTTRCPASGTRYSDHPK